MEQPQLFPLMLLLTYLLFGGEYLSEYILGVERPWVL